MSDRHTEIIKKPLGDDLLVHFSPEVTRQFARLEAAVHDSPHFADEMLWELQDRADGEPLRPRTAILSIAVIVRETMRHIQATGDKRAEEALSGLIDALTELEPDRQPVVLEKSRKHQNRGV